MLALSRNDFDFVLEYYLTGLDLGFYLDSTPIAVQCWNCLTMYVSISLVAVHLAPSDSSEPSISVWCQQ